MIEKSLTRLWEVSDRNLKLLETILEGFKIKSRKCLGMLLNTENNSGRHYLKGKLVAIS